MWHEARKHERKLRGMMVDYKKRAERRREYYEKIVSVTRPPRGGDGSGGEGLGLGAMSRQEPCLLSILPYLLFLSTVTAFWGFGGRPLGFVHTRPALFHPSYPAPRLLFEPFVT